MINVETRPRCAAVTKSGKPCKNLAREGREYCHIHRSAEVGQSEPQTADLSSLLSDLDDLVSDLRRAIPESAGQQEEMLTPEKLVQALRQNLGRVTPDLVKEIAASFEGATVEDLLDPETWKGMGYMVSYSMRFQAEQLLERLKGNQTEQ